MDWRKAAAGGAVPFAVYGMVRLGHWVGADMFVDPNGADTVITAALVAGAVWLTPDKKERN